MADRGDLMHQGELRHEKCRWGSLTEEFTMPVDLDPKKPESWTPGVAPLCNWQPPAPHPPALARKWGGDIDLARDCAVCPCYAEIEVPQRDDPDKAGTEKD